MMFDRWCLMLGSWYFPAFPIFLGGECCCQSDHLSFLKVLRNLGNLLFVFSLGSQNLALLLVPCLPVFALTFWRTVANHSTPRTTLQIFSFKASNSWGYFGITNHDWFARTSAANFHVVAMFEFAWGVKFVVLAMIRVFESNRVLCHRCHLAKQFEALFVVPGYRKIKVAFGNKKACPNRVTAAAIIQFSSSHCKNTSLVERKVLLLPGSFKNFPKQFHVLLNRNDSEALILVDL